MPSRPFSCEQCHRTFRNSSGREWHIAHAHDIQNNLASIREEYKSKTDKLVAENQALIDKNDLDWAAHFSEKIRLINEQIEAIARESELIKTNNRLEHEKEIALLALILQPRGNRQFPNSA